MPLSQNRLPLPDNMLLRYPPSAFPRLTRCTKRLQPPHDISDSHTPHLRILLAVSSGTKDQDPIDALIGIVQAKLILKVNHN